MTPDDQARADGPPAAASDYRISRCSPDDRDAIARFQRLLWGGGLHGNAAYLDWKYHQNPYLDDRYVLLAFSHGAVVGMLGAFGACWEAADGQRMTLPCVADDVVAPEHRGGPLFRRLVDELLARLRADGVPWLLDFGDQPAAPAMLMRGWHSIGPWAVASAPIRSGRRPQGAPIEGGGLGRRSRAAIRTSTSLDPAAMAELVSRLPPPGGFHHVRDTEYFAWRQANPLAEYHFVVAGSDPLDGYLVAHRSPGDTVGPTTVVECEAVGDDIWSDLLEAALDWLPGPSVSIWARDLRESRADSLTPLGFRLDSPTGRITRDVHLPNLMLRPTGAAADAPWDAGLLEPSSWDLRGVCGRSWR